MTLLYRLAAGSPASGPAVRTSCSMAPRCRRTYDLSSAAKVGDRRSSVGTDAGAETGDGMRPARGYTLTESASPLAGQR